MNGPQIENKRSLLGSMKQLTDYVQASCGPPPSITNVNVPVRCPNPSTAVHLVWKTFVQRSNPSMRKTKIRRSCERLDSLHTVVPVRGGLVVVQCIKNYSSICWYKTQNRNQNSGNVTVVRECQKIVTMRTKKEDEPNIKRQDQDRTNSLNVKNRVPSNF